MFFLRHSVKSYTRFRLVPKSRTWMTLNGVSRDSTKFFSNTRYYLRNR